MWGLVPTETYERRFRQYRKSHPRELAAALDNLDTVHRALKAGAKPVNTHFGFLHHEPKGVWAIDQKGGGKALKQIRVYVYAQEPEQSLVLLTIGDKRSQREDIAYCTRIVDKHKTKG